MVASCWFFLSLHTLLTMHGHRNLNKICILSLFFFLLMFNTNLFRLTGRSCVGLRDLLLLLGDWLLVTFFILCFDGLTERIWNQSLSWPRPAHQEVLARRSKQYQNIRLIIVGHTFPVEQFPYNLASSVSTQTVKCRTVTLYFTLSIKSKSDLKVI